MKESLKKSAADNGEPKMDARASAFIRCSSP